MNDDATLAVLVNSVERLERSVREIAERLERQQKEDHNDHEVRLRVVEAKQVEQSAKDKWFWAGASAGGLGLLSGLASLIGG